MYISQTNSTNSWLKEHPDCDVVWTSWQTAGRGQAGNSWESEAGKNVLFSMRLTKPQVAVDKQFALTMMVSLAVQKVVQSLLPNEDVTIKWPNDIYVSDKKICGILIENRIVDKAVEEAIIGIGLNVNQTKWMSGAPNPTSVKQISGVETDIEQVSAAIEQSLRESQHLLARPEELKKQYLAVLYRFGQKALYAEREVNVLPSKILIGHQQNAFEAIITDVTEQGELVLQLENKKKKYHFKEIQFIL